MTQGVRPSWGKAINAAQRRSTGSEPPICGVAPVPPIRAVMCGKGEPVPGLILSALQVSRRKNGSVTTIRLQGVDATLAGAEGHLSRQCANGWLQAGDHLFF